MPLKRDAAQEIVPPSAERLVQKLGSASEQC